MEEEPRITAGKAWGMRGSKYPGRQAGRIGELGRNELSEDEEHHARTRENFFWKWRLSKMA
jgi:hypothetical protein